MAKSKLKLTKTAIKQILKKSEFDPNGKTPFSIVASMENPGYCLMKAAELAIQAQGDKNNQLLIEQAISLLALARAQIQAAESVLKPKIRKSRAKVYDTTILDEVARDLGKKVANSLSDVVAIARGGPAPTPRVGHA